MATRAGLDRQRVVEAAARLIDAEGLGALSLARVAADLGVQVPSLYNHIAGLDGLRIELAIHSLRLLQSALARAAIGKSRDDAIFAIADAYRAYVKSHPGLYQLVNQVPPDATEELRRASGAAVEVVALVLEAYGLHGEDAIHAIRALRSLVHGFSSLEVAGSFALPYDLDQSYRWLLTNYLDGLRAHVGSSHQQESEAR